MKRPQKTLALTAAVTGALVSASVQAETYVCESFWGTRIFKRSDDGKGFYTPASKDPYGEDPRVDYTTLRETDDIIWLYEVEFLDGLQASDTCDEVCQSDREILRFHQISKKYLSYIFYNILGAEAGEDDHQFHRGHKACTVIP